MDAYAMLTAAEIENGELRADRAQLITEKDHWIVRCEEREAEIERLRAALKNIAGITEPDYPAHALHRCRETARRALDAKE